MLSSFGQSLSDNKVSPITILELGTSVRVLTFTFLPLLTLTTGGESSSSIIPVIVFFNDFPILNLFFLFTTITPSESSSGCDSTFGFGDSEQSYVLKSLLHCKAQNN